MIRTALCALVLAATAGHAQDVATAPGAVLRALDKFSGDVVDIRMQSGRIAEFGRLAIVLRECRYPAGNPAGDAYAAVEIAEQGRDGIIFSGWMIASAPALSAMDHARYDVWLMRCTTS
ncbi:MAG: DUF2155 domain-containing protein [Pseudomonadota bacterium]